MHASHCTFQPWLHAGVTLRGGHQSLVCSGSKDTLIKMWDPRVGGSALQTLHAHKAQLSLAWHRNGHWLLSSARDHMVKVAAILLPGASAVLVQPPSLALCIGPC